MQGGHVSHNPHDHFLRRRDIKELLHLKDDDSGYIEGKVFMIWPPRNKLHRINLEVAEGPALYRFEVEVPHKDGIAFRPHERVSVALKGVKVDRRKESSAPHYFPVTLRFPDGVVLKYLHGVRAGQVVDTWEGNADEWYNPSMVHSISDTVIVGASEIHHDPVLKTHLPVLSPPRGNTSSHPDDVRTNQLPLPSTAVANGAATAQSMQRGRQPNSERLGRLSKRARKRRKPNKEKESAFSSELANDTDGPRSTDPATHYYEQSRCAIDGPSANASESYSQKSSQVRRHSDGGTSIREDSEIALPRENKNTTMTAPEPTVPALQLKAGVCTQRGDVFTALGDLQKGHSMVNVIAVVTSISPEKRTKTSEWCRSFSLVDPSTPQQSVVVRCFQKKYLEWLPQVQKDDIVILRRLKIVEFNKSLTAMGYGDKLRWAIYDPLRHSIRPPNKGDVPEKETTDGGMGYEFSPYWEPFQDSNELEYCRKIGDWWKAKRELEGPNAIIVECSLPVTKQHRLVSEASPDLPPVGFFNCTVEILQKFSHHNGTINVYVTDYTASALVQSVQATWCPPELSDRVLQCTMWDNACNIARMMNPGEYWYLHNIRARWNPSHYMEGTMQLAEKVTQLDETNTEAEPHLKALLVRKKELKSNRSSLNTGPASSHVFPEMLLQDVDESASFITCIVELLHVDLDSRNEHFVYVTDYTYNPDLPNTVSRDDWAHNLEHRVLNVRLDDSQAKASSDLRPGSVYTIHNLRIKRLGVSSSMQGCLGGEQKLIVPLHDSLSHEAQRLKRNKEKWERENTWSSLTAVLTESHEEAHGPQRQLSTNLDWTTLREVLARPAPNVFRALARATDFFPFSLEDACILRCTKCNSTPPPSFNCCPRCDDMTKTHSKWIYCLYIQLQDEGGSELIVSLSGKKCTLLQSVDPTDLRGDRDAFRKFLERVDPVLGNLRGVHEAWSRNEQKAIESPPMIFTLESWNVGDEKGYGLLDCEPA